MVLLRFILCLVLLGVALPAEAGGAWPRGKGKFFGSLTWSSWGEYAGYIAALTGQSTTTPLESTEEIGTYFEYGLSDRLTFGLDGYHRPAATTGSTILFLRAALAPASGPNRYSTEIGVGTIRDGPGTGQQVIRAGLAWGRGYESRFGNGWAEVDAKVGHVSEDAVFYYKADATLGLNRTDRNTWILQLQLGAIDDNPGYARLAPSLVRRLGNRFSVEAGLLAGVQNDNSAGLKLGGWLDF
ncbi:hypothetical protein [Aliiruegeria haliotis]|nr:hypothetical protein [Aliiruegeria haliotis]